MKGRNDMTDRDTIINGLAHELWAMAQGQAPIEDVVTPMMAELHVFAAVCVAENSAEIKRLTALLAMQKASYKREMAMDAATAHVERERLLRLAKRYLFLSDGDGWPAVFHSSDAPEPLRGEHLDAAIDEAMTP
jgi:hypothetical protein